VLRIGECIGRFKYFLDSNESDERRSKKMDVKYAKEDFGTAKAKEIMIYFET